MERCKFLSRNLRKPAVASDVIDVRNKVKPQRTQRYAEACFQPDRRALRRSSRQIMHSCPSYKFSSAYLCVLRGLIFSSVCSAV